MIEMQRTPQTRILKHREVTTADAIRPAAMELDGAPKRASVAIPAETPRCTTKEARLVAVEGGAQAVEVRCSCGEWTRVELQVGSAVEAAR